MGAQFVNVEPVKTESFLEIEMVNEVEDQSNHLEDTGQADSQSQDAGDDNDRA